MKLDGRHSVVLGQLGRFSASGVVNTALGASTILIFTALGTHYFLANAMGYAVGLLTSFLLNKNWTFKAKSGRDTGELARFIAVFAVAYSVNIATVTIAIEVLRSNALAAQVVGIVFYTMISFVGMKYVVFRSTDEKKPDIRL